MEFTKDEFLAYVLLYAANADFAESRKERDFILKRVPRETYIHVHRIFDEDSDMERVEKILENVKRHNYDAANPEALLEEIKRALSSDGEMDAAEWTFLVGLRRLLKSAS